MNKTNAAHTSARPGLLPFTIEACSAWSPGRQSLSEWDAWLKAPDFSASSETPAIPFVKASLRRRASAISRMMMWVSHAVVSTDSQSQPFLTDELTAVFATEGGESATTLELLQTLAAKEALSPMKFSLSVHNASAGLYSLATGNKAPSTTVSAGADTVACGLLEALATLHTPGTERVLFVAADEWLPEELRNHFIPTCYHYALAILLRRSGNAEDANDISCTYLARDTVAPIRDMFQQKQEDIPQAFQLIRWLLQDENRLSLEGPSFTLALEKNGSCRTSFRSNDVE